MEMKKLLCVLLIAAIFAASAAAQAAKAPVTFKYLGSWNAADGRIEPSEQPKSAYWKYVGQKTGAAPLITGLEWGQGAEASGEKYDMILLRSPSLVRDLIAGGVLGALDELLPAVAPNVWKEASNTQWDLVRSVAPDRKIYFIPQWRSTKWADGRGSMVRKDWLDKLGMKVPTTVDELLAFYRAVRDKDPNGNGLKDEIPVSGRAGLRWCDDLFMMWGVAMEEGYPRWRWDDAKKVMVCDQVSAEMKSAVAFLRQLVSEGLMDKEFITQNRADWVAKVASNRVGHWWHLSGQIDAFINNLVEKDPKVKAVFMPLPRVPGLPKQLSAITTYGDPIWGFTKDSKVVREALKHLDWGYTTEGLYYLSFGIPDVDWKRDASGKIVKMKDLAGPPPIPTYAQTITAAFIPETLQMSTLGDMKMEFQNALIANGGYVTPADDGMPSTIYEGYADYVPQGAKTYVEYCSKMVMGELPMSAWDDYVKRWNDAGGAEVVKRATAWYKTVHNIK
jgi:putative aldouronate transport system substrate-binding protein